MLFWDFSGAIFWALLLKCTFESDPPMSPISRNLSIDGDRLWATIMALADAIPGATMLLDAVLARADR